MSKLSAVVILITTLIPAVVASGQVEVPNVAWLHTIGSTTAITVSDDWATGMALDPAGYLYIAGGTGSFHYNNSDALLVKLNATGKLEWTTLLEKAEGMRVALDADHNVFLAGRIGIWTTGFAAFLAKFNSDGRLQWNRAWTIPGTASWLDGWDAIGLATDGRGNAYVSGTASAYAFLAKFDSAGNLDWSKIWNYANYINSGANGVAVDAAYNVYVAGNVGNDAFLTQFNSTGESQWTRALSKGHLQVRIREIAIDGLGNIYGAADSELWTGPNALNSSQAFLAKFGPDGSSYWVKTLVTSSAADLVYGLAIDASGNPFVVGDRWISIENGEKEVFLAELDSAGQLSLSMGTLAHYDVHSVGVAVDPSGGIYVGGTVSNVLPEARPATNLNAVVTDTNATMRELAPIVRDANPTLTNAASKVSRVSFTLDRYSRDSVVVLKLEQHLASTPTTTERSEAARTSSIVTVPVAFVDFPAILIAILAGLAVIVRKRLGK